MKSIKRLLAIFAAVTISTTVFIGPVITVSTCAIGVAGCGTVYKTAILLTDAEDAIMREWARAHNDHLTTADMDLKVMAAHSKFNSAKKVAAAALRTYNAGGDKAAYERALEAARAAIDPLFDLLSPVLSAQKMTALRANVAAANQP